MRYDCLMAASTAGMYLLDRLTTGSVHADAALFGLACVGFFKALGRLWKITSC